MIVRVNDHVSRSLPVEDHNLLVMGDRVPRPGRNSHLLSFDCCHIWTVAVQVRKHTEVYGPWTLASLPSGMRRAIGALPAGITALSLAGTSLAAETVSVQVQRKPTVRKSVHISFHARTLRGGGYYYAVIVSKPYKRYTRTSPPPCATSSDMQRTDYGFPSPSRAVALALTPAKSPTEHWCPGDEYVGAIYAVPHPPPCESAYPCRAEPYKEPCVGVKPGCVLGVVARPEEWAYPHGLPTPLA